MKRLICVFLTLILATSVVACGQKAPETPQEVVKEFYSRFTQCVIDMEYPEADDILDMDSIQSYNLVSRVKESILLQELTLEAGEPIGTEYAKYKLEFKETEYIDENNVKITVNVIDYGNKKPEPTALHVYFGINYFTLSKKDGKWKITTRELEGIGIPMLEEYNMDKKLEFDPKTIEESWRKDRGE